MTQVQNLPTGTKVGIPVDTMAELRENENFRIRVKDIRLTQLFLTAVSNAKKTCHFLFRVVAMEGIVKKRDSLPSGKVLLIFVI